MLHVYESKGDLGKGPVPLKHVASVSTWRQTHTPRREAFQAAVWEQKAVKVLVYDDAGRLVLIQTQRGTL